MKARFNTLGFTIIEVMIVLAIAGLILLIVFLAFPNLRRNADNNGRKHDAALLVAAITNCLADHNNDYTQCMSPNSIPLQASELSVYTGFHYGASGTTQIGPWPTEPNWLFGLECNSSGTWFVTGTGPKTFVVTYLQQSGDGSYYSRCIDGGS